MKKIFCVIIFLLVCAASSSPLFAAERRFIRLGLLSKMNSTEESFAEVWKRSFAPDNEALQIAVKFYDSLSSMQMALNAGDIDQMVLPDAIANYVLAMNPDCEIALVLRSNGMGLAFGFREDESGLRDEFNRALQYMRNNWILAAIEGVYIAAPRYEDPAPVEFKKFPDSQTIRVAVTGDLPPIDFIAPDGTPAGFNTAVLAEIGMFLQKNIELVNVDTGARTSALASGRADVVFWYEVDTSGKLQTDVPEGVILSTSYFGWYKFIHLKKAEHRKEDSAVRGWDLGRELMDLFYGGR
ncbi:MAG: transporter substrate-binding domain-containing protein [Synergistaceae bacterium]|nr:transporter substrate-binding domain-containing protein [Synergistaceae bacterium]